MIPRPRHLSSMVVCAMLLAGCPRPGAVAPGSRATAAPRPVEPVPQGSAVPLPSATPTGPATPAPTPTPLPVDPKRGIPAGATAWLFHTGPVSALGELGAVAARYRLIALDADPDMKKVTAAQITALKAGGRTQVLGWLELGSMDPARPLWTRVGAPNPAYWLGPRAEQPGAQWLNPADPRWTGAVLDNLARLLAGAGVDGFLVDHVELAEHLATAADGPCGSGCRQGMIDALARLRVLYPDKLIVVRGATGDVLRLSTATGGRAVVRDLDGVVGTDVFGPTPDADHARELATWAAMKLTVNGKPFFLGTDDRVPGCDPAAVQAAAEQARAAGLVPGVRDAAGACKP